MAAVTITDWIPEENSSSVITRVMTTSAVEALAGRREPMGSLTKSVPRAAGVTSEVVQKSATYSEDASANDDVTLTAVKFGLSMRVAEEDLGDSLANVIETKRMDWATSYARHLDNACLGTSAAANGTTVPFKSVYRAVVNDAGNGGYTADDNRTTAPTATAPTYDQLSSVLGLYEVSDYFDEGRTVVIAHPSYKEVLRGIKDTQGRPIFQEGAGDSPDTLFGYAITWSLGCRVNATASPTPTGAPLLIVGNRDYLILGVRSGPESMMAGADASFLTDEVLLKMRARRAFVPGEPGAFSLLENVA